MATRRALALLWLRWRWRGWRGCVVGALYRRGGPAGLERLLADLAAEERREVA
jgi:hypothetical protein